MITLLIFLQFLAVAQDDPPRDKNVYVEVEGIPFFRQLYGPDLANEIPKGCGRCAVTIKKQAADFLVQFRREGASQWRWAAYRSSDGREVKRGLSNEFMAGSDCGRAIQKHIEQRVKKALK